MKQVIFFHPYFSDGGVERTNLGLAKGLIESGYKVTFLTTSYTNHFMKEIKELNIEFISLGDKKVSFCVFDVVNYLNKISGNQKIYFISCQYYVNIFSMIASFIVKNRKNIKFINAERNHMNEFLLKQGIKNKLLSYLIKYFYKFSDLIIANSQETANDLSAYIGMDVKFSYNPTINTRVDNLKNEPINEKWFLEDNRETIISIGRLTYQKDLMTLVKAYQLFDNKKQYKLVILGDGELREELECFIEKNNLKNDVYLPGFEKNPYKFLNQSSLFVLSSVYEGLPNVLIEALYLGIPAISTKCKSGPAEILIDERLLVDVGDYKSMAKKMEFMLNNKNEAYRLLNKAFTQLDRFKYENSTESFIEVIEK